jgi:hypothetical protein
VVTEAEAEAARLLRVAHRTLNFWLEGAEYRAACTGRSSESKRAAVTCYAPRFSSGPPGRRGKIVPQALCTWLADAKLSPDRAHRGNPGRCELLGEHLRRPLLQWVRVVSSLGRVSSTGT